MTNDDEKPREAPLKFRASLDPSDPGYAVLQASDELQAQLAAKINSPFAQKSPRDLIRAKALVTIESLSNPDVLLSDYQQERLAECYFQIGRFDLAVEHSIANKDLYRQYEAALWRDDNETCEHPIQHAYIKEHVWSVKHNREVELVACNIPECRDWQIADAPDDLKQKHQAQKSIQGSTAGMTIEQAKAWHQQNLR